MKEVQAQSDTELSYEVRGTNIVFANLSNLVFDYENPRLPLIRRSEEESSIITYMLEFAKVTDLMLSIGEQGFFGGEPLLVVKRDDSKFTVVEGNRRLAALKLLKSPELATILKERVKEISLKAKRKPDVIPVVEYENKDDVLGSLGFRHVTGVDEWSSLAKARYVSLMLAKKINDKDDYNEKLKSIARLIGSKKDYVERILKSYRLYEQINKQNFYGIRSLTEESIRFSYVTTALSYSNIESFLEIKDNQDGSYSANDERLKDITTWFFQRKENGTTIIGESRNLKHLNSIVWSDRALDHFRTNLDIQTAVLYTSEPSDTFTSILQRCKNDLSSALLLFSSNKEYIIPDPVNEKYINEMSSTLTSLRAIIINKQ